MALAVGLASLALVVLLHRSLQHNVDDRAALRLHDVAGLAQREQLPASLAGGDEDGTAAQVVVAGQVLAQSPVVRRAAPLADFVPAGSGLTIRTVRRPPIAGGDAYRVAAATTPTRRGPAVVYVAASLEPVTDSINALEALLAVVDPLLLAVVAVMTWFLVGRTLRPVEDIRRRVAAVSAADLSSRVPAPATADEVSRLAQTMNDMLDRLENAGHRQRRFVSDAAHELRTPLATLCAELETAIAHPTTDQPALLRRLQRTAARLGRLVEDLLVLATSEEKQPRRAEVDLDELLLGQLESFRAASRVRLEVDRLDGARVAGDPDQIDRVLANLLDNATRHASSTVTLRLTTTGAMAELVVANDGAGIPLTDRRRVFERFARVDDARSRDRGGAGLGLSIARRIVENHDGTIEVADAASGARVVVRLPLLRPAGPPDELSAATADG
jgi:signal transduction histidine kinase